MQELKEKSKKPKKVDLNVQYAEPDPQEDDDLQRSNTPVNNWSKTVNKSPEKVDTL